MKSSLTNVMLAQALTSGKLRANTRIGKIIAYDPNTFSVRVEVQPFGEATGWMPLGSPWVGNNWGAFFAPSIGDEVVVNFQEGLLEAGLVSARLFTDASPPLQVPAGEAWLVHSSGSSLKFKTDGSVELVSASKLNITVTGDVTLNVQGAVNATVSNGMTLLGDLTVNGVLTTAGFACTGAAFPGVSSVATFAIEIDSSVDVKVGTISLKTHKHIGVSTGPSQTGIPV